MQLVHDPPTQSTLTLDVTVATSIRDLPMIRTRTSKKKKTLERSKSA